MIYRKRLKDPMQDVMNTALRSVKRNKCIVNIHLTIESMKIERVDNYKYLGTWIIYDIDQTKEIKIHIEIVWFIKLKKFLCCRDITLMLGLSKSKLMSKDASVLHVFYAAVWHGGTDFESNTSR